MDGKPPFFFRDCIPGAASGPRPRFRWSRPLYHSAVRQRRARHRAVDKVRGGDRPVITTTGSTSPLAREGRTRRHARGPGHGTLGWRSRLAPAGGSLGLSPQETATVPARHPRRRAHCSTGSTQPQLRTELGRSGRRNDPNDQDPGHGMWSEPETRPVHEFSQARPRTTLITMHNFRRWFGGPPGVHNSGQAPDERELKTPRRPSWARDTG